jgi:hypothetical protein
VSTIEELLERKSSGSGLENREYGRKCNMSSFMMSIGWSKATLRNVLVRFMCPIQWLVTVSVLLLLRGQLLGVVIYTV